jgi:hypothetical protein
VEISVALTAYNRPHYLDRVLASWASPLEASGVLLFAHVEPGGPQDVWEHCRDFQWGGAHLNRKVLGNAENTRQAIAAAFQDCEADFVILAEDDMLVGQDVLDYFEFCAERYRQDSTVVAVSAFRQLAPSVATVGGVQRTRSFPGQVWGTWRDRWEELISQAWNEQPEKWDLWIHQRLCRERHYEVVVPALSRSQHIGQQGVHMIPELYEQGRSSCFAADLRPEGYSELVKLPM